MIRVFHGSDRVRIRREIQKWLGADYETIEGGELTPADLPNIFRGVSLFDAAEKERAILILDVMGSEAAGFLADYADTKHRVAILEAKPDARSEAWKKLSKAAEVVKYDALEVDRFAAFDVFRTAKRDGAAAVAKLRTIRDGMEAKAFVGVMASQAFKDYSERAGAREKRVLREMAKLDMDFGKVTASEASAEREWNLVEGFLMRVKGM